MTKHIAAIALCIGTGLGASDIRSTSASFEADEGFPNTRQLGEAAVQYLDEHLAVVAAYYYSQRHLESPWLLIETAITARTPTVIGRDDIRLVTPGGRQLPLPSQARFAEGIRSTRLLVQNARATRHAVRSYFTHAERTEPFKFFELPGGGIIRSDFRVDRHTLALGDLFFESPAGTWAPGTYTLLIAPGPGSAALPIELK